MLRVMLVDDEPFIMQGLSVLINWNELGFEIVKMAGNGGEAYEYLKNKRVDLIIADISMPVMTGIELLERIREERLSDAWFIILSGYNEFEYARRAIRYACMDYLLKPISRQALNESLQSLCCQIQKEKEQNRILEDSSREREEELSRIRRTLLNDLINVQSRALSENKLEEQYQDKYRAFNARFNYLDDAEASMRVIKRCIG